MFDLARPLAPTLVGHAEGQAGDIESTGDRMYAADGARTWREAGAAVDELPRPAAALRARGELVAALDAVQPYAFLLYKTVGERRASLGSLALGEQVADLAWGD